MKGVGRDISATRHVIDRVVLNSFTDLCSTWPRKVQNHFCWACSQFTLTMQTQIVITRKKKLSCNIHPKYLLCLSCIVRTSTFTSPRKLARWNLAIAISALSNDSCVAPLIPRVFIATSRLQNGKIHLWICDPLTMSNRFRASDHDKRRSIAKTQILRNSEGCERHSVCWGQGLYEAGPRHLETGE